jgi:hypothetical protein
MVKGDGTAARALAALVLLASASVALAGPGNGIRMGGSAGRLHPFLELEGRYDSNVAYSNEGQKQAGFVYHLRPGLAFESHTDPAALDVSANADWAQYTGKNSNLSRIYGEAQLGVGLNRKGELGLEVTDAFRRSQQTQVLTLGGAVISNVNDLEVAVPYRPGGGAFITTLSGGWNLQTFEPFVRGRLCAADDPAADDPRCDPDQLSKLNYNDLSGKLELRWRFLPKTAALVQGEYWKRMVSNAAVAGQTSGWRGMAGLAGLFTAHLAGTVKGGWASTSAKPTGSSTWYANVEGEWIPTDTTSVKLGYLHDSDADPGIGGAYAVHRIYFDSRALLAARYTVMLSAEYQRRDYRGNALIRSVDLVTASPAAEVEIVRWLRAGLGVAYTRRTSRLVSADSPNLPGFKFDKYEAFLRLRGTY